MIFQIVCKKKISSCIYKIYCGKLFIKVDDLGIYSSHEWKTAAWMPNVNWKCLSLFCETETIDLTFGGKPLTTSASWFDIHCVVITKSQHSDHLLFVHTDRRLVKKDSPETKVFSRGQYPLWDCHRLSLKVLSDHLSLDLWSPTAGFPQLSTCLSSLFKVCPWSSVCWPTKECVSWKESAVRISYKSG